MKAPRVTIEQLVLLAALNEGRVTAPEAARRFDVTDVAIRLVLVKLEARGALACVGSLRVASAKRARKAYGPTEHTRGAIRIPLDTPLKRVAPVRVSPPVARRSRGSGKKAGTIKVGRGYVWHTRLVRADS